MAKRRTLGWAKLLLPFLCSATAVSSALAATVTYTYDPAGRLTRADSSDGTSIIYTYDNSGNLVQRLVSAGGGATHDLAVVDIKAPAAVTSTSPVTRAVQVQIQNRSPHDETVQAGHLGDGLSTGLVRLWVTPSDDDGESCQPAIRTLDATKNAALFKKGPRVLKPKQKLTVHYLVTYECKNAKPKDKLDATPGDYAHSATVHHEALDGSLADTHTADDACPRSVPPPFVVDPNPDGTIKDKGCGEKKADKTFGAPIVTNVVGKP